MFRTVILIRSWCLKAVSSVDPEKLGDKKLITY